MSLELNVADSRQGVDYQTVFRTAGMAPLRETLPTGLRALDQLLDGGWLAGATHCISGEPTSGAASFFYRALAEAQAQGIRIIYLEMEELLDQPAAAAAGVDVERLLLLSGTPLKQALMLIRSLARRGLPLLLALDHPSAGSLSQLKALWGAASLTVLALSPSPLPGMQVTLECERQDWRLGRGDAIGFISELRLTGHPFLPYRQVRARLDFPRGAAASARW